MRLSFAPTSLLLVGMALAAVPHVFSFQSAPAFSQTTRFNNLYNGPSNAFSRASSTSSDDAAFSSFAASLEEPSGSGSTKGSKSRSRSTLTNRTWKNDLDELVDPRSSPARRQILLSQLLTANAEIRAAVEAALRDRKVRYNGVFG